MFSRKGRICYSLGTKKYMVFFLIISLFSSLSAKRAKIREKRSNSEELTIVILTNNASWAKTKLENNAIELKKVAFCHYLEA